MSLVVRIKPIRLTTYDTLHDTRECSDLRATTLPYRATYKIVLSFSMSIRLVLRGETELSLPVETIHDDDGHQPADNGSLWRTCEDEIILNYVKAHGPKWTEIASRLPGRTDISCRNRHQRMRKNLEKYGEIVDARKKGYRSNSKKKKKMEKIKKAKNTGPKSERHTESKSNDNTVLLIDPCEMDQMVLPSEDELFSNTLPPGDYEIFPLDDDELLGVILNTASVLVDGSV